MPLGAPVERTLTLTEGERSPLTVALDPGGSVRVTVVDERGRAVPGAIVLFGTGAGLIRTARPDRTDRQGILVRHDLPLQQVSLRARDPKGREGRGRVIVEAKGTAQATIKLEPAKPR